jgi:nitrite reductase (NADH) small subunit
MQQTNIKPDAQDAVWYTACKRDDLVEGSGVCALVNGQQVAIFYLPDEQPALYAIDNFDPIGRANVLARGIVGDVRGELVVASPLYKEHFSLASGRCLEKDYTVRAWPIRRNGDSIEVQYPATIVHSVA